MIGVEPIVLVEIAKKITLTKKSRCGDDAKAEESIFPSGIRQFNHIDIVLTDRNLYFGRRVRIVDHNEMLDIFVTLIGHALDCLQNGRITRRRGNDRHKGVWSAHHNLGRTDDRQEYWLRGRSFGVYLFDNVC